jgi:hypothetical protein
MSLGTTRVVKQMAGPCLPVYRAIIDGIVSSGAPPPDDVLSDLTRLPSGRVAAVLAALAEQDWLTLHADGTLASIYPFSLTPTGIVVSIGGVERHAMCAIDALGMAAMLNRPVLVLAGCAECDAPISIATTRDVLENHAPPATVVTARYAIGPASRTRCGVMRFACSAGHGRRWLDAHGLPDDVVLQVEEAYLLARRQFENCYSRGRVVKPFERKPQVASRSR